MCGPQTEALIENRGCLECQDGLGLEYSQPHSHRHGQEPSVTIHAQPLMGRPTLTLQMWGHIRHPALFSGFTTLYLERPAPALVPHKAGTPRGPQLWHGV